eukprot:10911265-Alexandrium_andersonii.AAC.1
MAGYGFIGLHWRPACTGQQRRPMARGWLGGRVRAETLLASQVCEVTPCSLGMPHAESVGRCWRGEPPTSCDL